MDSTLSYGRDVPVCDCAEISIMLVYCSGTDRASQGRGAIVISVPVQRLLRSLTWGTVSSRLRRLHAR
eukprot:1128759-Rhodomonas_salina.1